MDVTAPITAPGRPGLIELAHQLRAGVDEGALLTGYGQQVMRSWFAGALADIEAQDLPDDLSSLTD